MRPVDCPTCACAADRNASLALQLRRTAQRMHVALGHQLHDASRCSHDVCADAWAVINGAVLASDRTRDRSLEVA